MMTKPGHKCAQLDHRKVGLLVATRTLISRRVLLKSFCKSQFLHKFVNLFFTSVIAKDKLTDDLQQKRPRLHQPPIRSLPLQQGFAFRVSGDKSHVLTT